MDCKIIRNPAMARKLLHKGNLIIDIKPSKDNGDQTVFVFEKTEKLP